MSEFSVETEHRDGNPEAIRTMRPLRGRVLIEIEADKPLSPLWTPESKGFDSKHHQHVGRVIAHGPPALQDGVEQPMGFAPGDRVLFVYAVALEKTRRFAGNLAIVAQEEVQAVLSRVDTTADTEPPPPEAT